MPLELDAIRDALAKKLPAIMVPSRLIALEELPLAPTGKIDRAELEARATSALETGLANSEREEPRNDLEAWLRPVFAHVLGRDDVELDRSFFEMGGHSLLAIRLLGRLTSERPDLKLDLATLFASPSVRALAETIARAQPGEAPTLVRLNPQRSDIEDELPLFCICGVQLYGPLARAMEADRPVFGAFLPIEASAVRGEGPPLEVRAMAEEYVALVTKHRPEGPYLLGGVSFGGLLAYEMAQILAGRGEEVKLLALFDTILPRALEDVPWLARARAKLGRLRGRPDAVLGALRRGAHKIGERVQKLGREASASEEMEALATRDAVLKDAAERYDEAVRPYSGHVVIFRARDGLGHDGERVRWDMGWTGLVPAHTPVHGVAGDHLGILRDPGVSEVASTLRTILSRTGRAPQ
jgi:thioesterase domain-containing protein